MDNSYGNLFAAIQDYSRFRKYKLDPSVLKYNILFTYFNIQFWRHLHSVFRSGFLVYLKFFIIWEMLLLWPRTFLFIIDMRENSFPYLAICNVTLQLQGPPDKYDWRCDWNIAQGFGSWDTNTSCCIWSESI